MRTGKLIVVLMAMVLFITMISGSSMAVDFDGEMYIDEGGYHAIPFTAENAGIYRFTVNSVNGESVAVLIMDTANFQRYVADETFEYEDYTVAVSEERQIALLAGNYYFVIDNSDRISPSPEGGVQVSYDMYEEFPFDDFFNNILLISVISIAIIAVVIIVLLYFLRKDERKRQESLRSYQGQGQTKYCIHCGQQMPAETNVCPHCGKEN